MMMDIKDIVFVGRSLAALKDFPLEAKRESGYQLDMVQRGEDPSDWKPMRTIEAGVREIRLREESGAYRVIYIAKLKEAVYVLHAFQKKTQKTAKADIETAKRALKTVLEERK
jgi:phage-related protein